VPQSVEVSTNGHLTAAAQAHEQLFAALHTPNPALSLGRSRQYGLTSPPVDISDGYSTDVLPYNGCVLFITGEPATMAKQVLILAASVPVCLSLRAKTIKTADWKLV